MYQISQGHRSNIVGMTPKLEDIPRIIREHMQKRWTGDISIRISAERAAARVGSIVVHYTIAKGASK